MVNLHYIPTWEGESAEWMRERHRMQSSGEYNPNVQIYVDDILSRIDLLLKKNKDMINENNV